MNNLRDSIDPIVVELLVTSCLAILASLWLYVIFIDADPAKRTNLKN